MTLSCCCDRISDGIDRIKKFADSARKQIQKQETESVFDPSEEISSAIQILSYKAQKDNVEFDFPRPKSKIELYGNPIKFYQMIMDLVSNAIDAYDNFSAANRKVAIRIKQEKEYLMISVQDWGCGIKEENLAKIFTPLFTTKSVDKGTGLGLSICKNIAEKDFGGTIEVASQENKGSVFRVKIPMQQA